MAFEALVPNVFWLKRPRENGEATMRGTAQRSDGGGGAGGGGRGKGEF